MDPLSALSLAAAVVQFVQFTTDLFNGTRKIYQSGASEKTERLEYIYETLSELSANLSSPSTGIRFVNTGLPKDTPSLTELATRCRKDCDELLAVIESIKSKSASGPRLWRSFRTAMTEVMKTGEIEQLRERIGGYQRLMVIHLCSVSSGMIEVLDGQVRALRFETQAFQSQRSQELNEMSQAIKSIQNKLDGFKSDHSKTCFSSSEIELLTARISELSLTSEEYARENEFLRGLNYKQRPQRHGSIATAHRRTFNWIFSAQNAETSESKSLLHWLKHENGIFWLSGRPGSGKSTLMKFIAGHPLTDEALATWSGSGKVIKACHYFWSAGTNIQRSQEGLLRSLIFDLLCQNPQLIRLVCPERWSKAEITASVSSNHSPWSQGELEKTVRTIATQDQFPIKICFFIDGLDEFSGDHAELCETLVHLSRCSGVKMLVSSRPWNVFEEIFGKTPDRKLYLHNLTRGDIQNYARSQLVEHPNWSTLVSEAGEGQALSLVEDITMRSRGVFLWVFLVTRVLREGLTNYDKLEELQDRLNSIPADLGQFFRAMLESVEPFYHDKMAGTLRFALAASEPLPVTLYCFHDLEYKDRKYATKEKVEPWDVEKLRLLEAPFARRLSSRCKGLLEIQGRRVEFLHRTVMDFLRTVEMSDFLSSKTPRDFNPTFSIFQAYVAWIKHKWFFGSVGLSEPTIQRHKREEEHLIPVLDEALSYYASDNDAKLRDSETALPWFDLVDDLEWSIRSMFPSKSESDSTIQIRAVNLFRQRALRAGLADYVSQKLEEDDSYLQDFQIPPLVYALGLDSTLESTTQQVWSDQRLELLEALLSKGQDPNQPYTWVAGRSLQETPWKAMVRKCVRESELCPALNTGVLSILVEFGADVNVNIACEEKFLPIWAELFSHALALSRELSGCVDSYIYLLDKMLAKANFEAPGKEVEALYSNLSLSQTASRKGRAKSPTKLAGTEMCHVITLVLRELCSGKPGTQRHSYQDLQLLAKAIGTFFRHVGHVPFSLLDFQGYIRAVFPANLANYLDGIIREKCSKENVKKEGRKRAHNPGLDDEVQAVNGPPGGSSKCASRKRRT
ncbi:hypothetical protein BKA56DRAFT_174743 [Ilyonectria sp. MPI-CAGE-AT-0026]|nr:hypothetical protein BKA56DRAFT_174743 [Ilyonectria sp. MPI-CAGE-AT-0026]